MKPPLVSIICTSYNHGDFVTEALDSVIQQSYKNVELIIVDNGSMDDSVRYIRDWLADHREEVGVRTIFNQTTINYCRSFKDRKSVV